MRVVIVLFDGFDELDAIGPYRVFSGAESAGVDLTVELATIEPVGRVTASHGIRVEPDGILTEYDPDLVVVPGGGWNDRAGPGSWAEAERGDLPAILARLHDNGARVAGVCTGGMLLARAGLLDGRPAVTHASALSSLAETGATVVDARVVDGGDVLTSGGVTAGIDLALHVLERAFGVDVASAVAESVEYEPRGSIYREVE